MSRTAATRCSSQVIPHPISPSHTTHFFVFIELKSFTPRCPLLAVSVGGERHRRIRCSRAGSGGRSHPSSSSVVMTTPLVVCRCNLLLATAQKRPPWQMPCPPPPRALPQAPPNNMLIVTSLLSLTPLPSCPDNASPANPGPPPPLYPNSATTVPTMQQHTHSHRHLTPPMPEHSRCPRPTPTMPLCHHHPDNATAHPSPPRPLSLAVVPRLRPRGTPSVPPHAKLQQRRPVQPHPYFQVEGKDVRRRQGREVRAPPAPASTVFLKRVVVTGGSIEWSASSRNDNAIVTMTRSHRNWSVIHVASWKRRAVQ